MHCGLLFNSSDAASYQQRKMETDLLSHVLSSSYGKETQIYKAKQLRSIISNGKFKESRNNKIGSEWISTVFKDTKKAH